MSLLSSVENLPSINAQLSLDGVGNDVFQMENPDKKNPPPENPISFEITPPTENLVDGATCLPDVVPKVHQRPSLISSNTMSSSLETDSSSDTPLLFQYNNQNPTAFPFNHDR